MKRKVNEGILTNILRVLLANDLEKRLNAVTKEIDTPEANAQAKRIRDGLDKLNSELEGLCKSAPNHPWCKKDRNFGTMKWK
jgi:uncharacterized small protein (DUF1192 family)